jgi:hypothetical protein
MPPCFRMGKFCIIRGKLANKGFAVLQISCAKYCRVCGHLDNCLFYFFRLHHVPILDRELY